MVPDRSYSLFVTSSQKWIPITFCYILFSGSESLVTSLALSHGPHSKVGDYTGCKYPEARITADHFRGFPRPKLPFTYHQPSTEFSCLIFVTAQRGSYVISLFLKSGSWGSKMLSMWLKSSHFSKWQIRDWNCGCLLWDCVHLTT